MLEFYIAKRRFSIIFSMLLLAGLTGNTQNADSVQPVWWFGGSVAANFNYYRGTTQMLNENLTVPTAFHKGDGVRPYISLLTEYRPNKVWGGMLHVAFDGRGGKFDGEMAPCHCAMNLSTSISYLTLEPSLRVAPFASAFYVFGGPTLNVNMSKAFTYTQEKQTDTRSDWSNVRELSISAQAGAGMDFPISARTSATQMILSPFVSFQTDFGHEPRSVESWDLYTIRMGTAFKFGKRGKSTPAVSPAAIMAKPVIIPAIVGEKEVQFSVRAPKVVPLKRNVKETFVLGNSVFFDLGSTEIPNRYVKLSQTQAMSFKEEDLQESQPSNLNSGRSSRQLAVYHNVLNIMGDRLRANPQSSITLTGSSGKSTTEGKVMAETIKQYLVLIF